MEITLSMIELTPRSCHKCTFYDPSSYCSCLDKALYLRSPILAAKECEFYKPLNSPLGDGSVQEQGENYA